MCCATAPASTSRAVIAALRNPAEDWARFDEALRDVVARPDVMTGEFAHPMAGTMTVEAAIDMLVTPDVFMHSWDLARASGQSVTLDTDYAAGLLSGMEGIEEHAPRRPATTASGSTFPRTPTWPPD